MALQEARQEVSQGLLASNFEEIPFSKFLSWLLIANFILFFNFFMVDGCCHVLNIYRCNCKGQFEESAI
jgi:hypothetical protein